MGGLATPVLTSLNLRAPLTTSATMTKEEEEEEETSGGPLMWITWVIKDKLMVFTFYLATVHAKK